MRIIGGKDYYDSAIAYGIDPGVVFVRDGRKLTNSQMVGLGGYAGISISLTKSDDIGKFYTNRRYVSADYYNRYRTIDGVSYSLKEHNVIFCGKLYKGVEIAESISMKPATTTFFWSMAKLEKWAAERDFVVGTSTPFWHRKDNNEDPFRPYDLPKDAIESMIRINASILMKIEEPDTSVGRGRIGWGECNSGWVADCGGLKDIGFQSALDPYTAFQELSMWVGGTLSANGPNTVTITDDKVKIAKHGFDKTSFRKPKA